MSGDARSRKTAIESPITGKKNRNELPQSLSLIADLFETDQERDKNQEQRHECGTVPPLAHQPSRDRNEEKHKVDQKEDGELLQCLPRDEWSPVSGKEGGMARSAQRYEGGQEEHGGKKDDERVSVHPRPRYGVKMVATLEIRMKPSQKIPMNTTGAVRSANTVWVRESNP